MALSLDFDIKSNNDCKGFTLTDTTGTGVGGYGNAGNPLVTDIDAASVVFFPPNGADSITIDVFNLGVFPNTSGVTVNIPATDLGMTTIPDGIWSFTYTVTDNTGPVTATLTKKGAVICHARCCLMGLKNEIAVSKCFTSDCNNDLIEKASTISMLIDVAQYAAGAGKPNKAEVIIDTINKLCISVNCENCKNC